MMNALKELLASKKAIAAMAGFIVVAFGRIGLDLPEATVIELLVPIVAYILGQGVADLGKERVKAYPNE